VSRTEAVIRGMGRSAGETIFVKRDSSGRELLEYSGYLFERIK
jgi:hypothetical protein